MALVAGLYAFVIGYDVVGVVAVVLAFLLGGAGMGWLAVAHRKVGQTERGWHAEYPGETYELPTS